MLTGSGRVVRVRTDLEMFGAFSAGAVRARSINNLGVTYIRFGVGDVSEDTRAKSLDDTIMVYMAEAVSVIVVVECCALALPLSEHQGFAVDVSAVGCDRMVEIMEVATKIV